MEKIKIKGRQMIEQFTKVLFSEISETNELLDQSTVDEMLKDINIATLIGKINRAVAARELVVGTDDTNLTDKAKEIQERFNIAKFNRIFKHILIMDIVYLKKSMMKTIIYLHLCLYLNRLLITTQKKVGTLMLVIQKNI